MKKKGILFLLICAMIILCVALSACSLVQVNEERQANRVLATVTVDLVKEIGDGVKVLGNDWDYTVSMDITRRDLVVTVNYAINYYSQLYSAYGMQYDYDVETLATSALKTLKTQKYNTICAMGELLAEANSTHRLEALYCLTEEYQAIYGKTLVPEGVLTISERYKAIKEVNEQFQTQLDGYIDATTNDERDNEKSEANNELSKYYNDGYFVNDVAIAYKNDKGNFVDGLYTTDVIDDGDEKTTDLDYTQIYAKVILTKTDKENKTVYIPIEETELKCEEDTNAKTSAKYITNKKATITYSGRVYAKITEENTDGYEVESFTSDAISYKLIAPRSQHKHDDEEEEEDNIDALRYITRDAWNGELSEEMTELKQSIFNPTPKTYADKDEKDAYRQLRNSFTSSNIGYTETEPNKGDTKKYNNFKYYNGLYYYYASQFETEVLSVKQYEVGAKIVEVSGEEISEEYKLLVLKDKANYEYLSKEEQVTKFFNTVKGESANGLADVYYVPIDALTTVTYEVDPTDKAYAPLFTLDNENNVTYYNPDYITKDGEKYTMKYAYLNDDGTYTINMIYVTHILLSFDNVPGLADTYKNTSADYTDEQKMIFIKEFVKQIKTCPQLTSYLADFDHDKEYKLSDVFTTDENGNLEYQTFAEAEAIIDSALAEAFETGKFDDLLNKFIELTEIYDDDSGKLTDAGYVVSAGDMENGWYEDFTATALNMYFNLLANGKMPTGYETADGSMLSDRLADAYSDYGVHKMFISFTPLYKVSIDSESGIGLETELDLEGTTRRSLIGESAIETKREKAFTDWKAKISEDEVNEHTVVNEKNYDMVIKDITK